MKRITKIRLKDLELLLSEKERLHEKVDTLQVHVRNLREENELLRQKLRAGSGNSA